MTVSEQIIQVLDALCEKFGVAVDWTSENVIPYVGALCTKLVAWEIWTSVAWIGIMTVVGILSVIYIAKRPFMDCYRDDDFIGGFINIAAHAFIFASFIVVTVQIFDIIKCVTFPEMHIFEYIQGLLNSGK